MLKVKKSTLPRFNLDNVKESLGMPFRFFEEQSGEWLEGFVGQCEIGLGITLKDYNSNDGDDFLYCWNCGPSSDSDMIDKANGVIVDILNHIYVNGETTFNTLMLTFDVKGEWNDLWSNPQRSAVGYCPF